MTFISDTFKFIGAVVGESVHQTAELAEGTYNLAADVATDISNIPSAIVDGYKEELFEAKPDATAEPKTED